MNGLTTDLRFVDVIYVLIVLGGAARRCCPVPLTAWDVAHPRR